MIVRRRRPAPALLAPSRGAWSSALVGALLVLTLCASAAAQTSSVGVITDGARASAIARLAGVRDGSGSVDAWARIGPDVGLGVVWRYAQVFGPLGNVIVEGGTDLLVAVGSDAPGVLGRAALGARGVFGPVALILRIDAGTVSEVALDGSVRQEAPRSALGATPGAWDAGARLALTYRVDRATTVTLEPRVRISEGAAATFVGATLRRNGVWDEYDLWFGVEAATVAAHGAAAVGVGTVWTRRREPDSSVRIWLGSDGSRVLPGAEVLLASRSPGRAVALGAAWTPHRLGSHVWQATLDLSSSSPAPDDGTWRLRTAIAGGVHDRTAAPTGRAPVTFSLSLTVERPWAAP
jgi:hypothetical protein